MHAKSSCFRPSWRALQLLTLSSVALCIIAVYVSSSSRYDFDLVIAKLPSLPKFPSLTDVAAGISSGTKDAWGGAGGRTHPIDVLIREAHADFDRALKTEAKSLGDAAAKYRKRRKRHPPPGFDAWYHFATEKGAVIVEEFWDQIYHDLGPFWGISPVTLRQQAHALKPRISIRDGNVTVHRIDAHVKLEQWADMLKTLASQKHVKLPDVDVPLDVNHEPRLVVPWETVDTALSLARPILPTSSDVHIDFAGLEDVENGNYTFEPEWLNQELSRHPPSVRPYWSLVRPACHPKSPARIDPVFTDIWHPQGHTSDAHSAVGLLPTAFPNHTFQGYVRNWTTAANVCLYPYLQGLHGAFVAPYSMSASLELFPLFGASKFAVNNEILVPGSAEWNSTDDLSFENRERVVPWEQKQNKLFWCGLATGGHNTEQNWQRFHRHRFVSMLNASHIATALPLGDSSAQVVALTETFGLPSSNPYRLSAQMDGRLAEWVESWADAAFTDLGCDIPALDRNICRYNSEYFSLAEPARVDELERYKYTAVLDGSSGDDGGEFVERLKSGAMTLRASVHRKWYDSRLWPWVHYVPMDNTFVDVYGIMAYFLGYQQSSSHETAHRRRKELAGHDTEAQHIAEAGSEWASKVLRKEDMLIYLYRLLLEYARLVDDSRERLGWIADLLEKDGK